MSAKKKKPLIISGLRGFLSGWQDSNLRPPAPKAGAMTGLRYTPNTIFFLTLVLSLSISRDSSIDLPDPRDAMTGLRYTPQLLITRVG